MMINILGRNRDKDKGKALDSWSRIWSMSLGWGGQGVSFIKSRRNKVKKRLWIWPLEGVPQ